MTPSKCSGADNEVPRNSSTFTAENGSLVCNQEWADWGAVILSILRAPKKFRRAAVILRDETFATTHSNNKMPSELQ